MKNFKLTLLAIILLMGYNSYSQWGFGAQAGLNFTRLGFSDAPQDVKDLIKSRTTFTLGGFTTYSLTDNIDVKGALMYSGKGTKFDASEGDDPYIKINYITIPIHAMYKYQIGYDEMYVTGFLGPYLGVALNAKSTNADILANISRGDFGFDFGAGFQYEKYTASLSYSLGLANINMDDGSSVKNRAFTITIGYIIKNDNY